MIVVTVARKPFAESTAAKNTIAIHTGGINIDACRIGEGDGIPAGPSIPNFKNQVYGHGFGGGRCDTSKGRFPANLILGHLPGCSLIGEKVVKSDVHYPASRPAGAGMGMLKNHPGQEGLVETRQREETVPNWQCAEGCPVAALDGHSGVSKSSGFGGRVITKRSSGKDRGGNSGYAYGEESRPEGTEMTTYGDEGGASRYFKQVGGQK